MALHGPEGAGEGEFIGAGELEDVEEGDEVAGFEEAAGATPGEEGPSRLIELGGRELC